MTTHRTPNRLKAALRSSRGFSLTELLAVVSILIVVSAVAVPAIVSSRADTIAASQKTDLQKVANELDTILTGLRGAPTAQMAVTTAGTTYTITGPEAGATAATGALAGGHTITGTVWTDGSYCLTSTATSGGGRFIYRNDTREVTTGTCPTSGFGALGSVAGGGLTYAWTGATNASASTASRAGVVTQTNLVLQPQANSLTKWSLGKGTGATATLAPVTEGGDTFLRFTRPADDTASTWRVIWADLGGALNGAPVGAQYTALLRVRDTATTNMSANLLAANGTSGGSGTPAAVGSAWEWRAWPITLTSTATSSTLLYIAPPTTLGATLDISNALVIAGNNPNVTYFDGSTAGVSATSLPPALALTATTPAAGVATVSWAANTSATSVVILVDGKEAVTVPATDLTATLTGLTAGVRTIVAYPVNANGYGPKTTTSITIASTAAGIADAVAPKITWNRLATSNGWVNYNTRSPGEGALWTEASYSKSGGIVDVRGLLVPGTTTVGTVLATLPEGFRPDFAMIFPVGQSTSSAYGTRTLQVATNGDITIFGTALTSTAYVSLDNIIFPAAGELTWTSIPTLLNGFTARAPATYGPIRYALDADGNAWFSGRLRTPDAGVSTDGTAIATLPSEACPGRYQHHVAGSSAGHGLLAFSASGCQLQWKMGSPGVKDAWISLAGMVALTPAGETAGRWSFPPTYLTGYTHFNSSATWWPPSYGQTSYGLVILRGLAGSPTTLNTSADLFPVPTDMRQSQRGLFAAVSNTCQARIDIFPAGGGPLTNGGLSGVAPCTAGNWWALDGIAYFPDNADDRY